MSGFVFKVSVKQFEKENVIKAYCSIFQEVAEQMKNPIIFSEFSLYHCQSKYSKPEQVNNCLLVSFLCDESRVNEIKEALVKLEVDFVDLS